MQTQTLLSHLQKVWLQGIPGVDFLSLGQKIAGDTVFSGTLNKCDLTQRIDADLAPLYMNTSGSTSHIKIYAAHL
jgi:hypothetical protein